jgi:hypothetical protein
VRGASPSGTTCRASHRVDRRRGAPSSRTLWQLSPLRLPPWWRWWLQSRHRQHPYGSSALARAGGGFGCQGWPRRLGKISVSLAGRPVQACSSPLEKWVIFDRRIISRRKGARRWLLIKKQKEKERPPCSFYFPFFKRESYCITTSCSFFLYVIWATGDVGTQE